MADLSELTGDYEMSLCNVAIMGTKYERTIPVASHTLSYTTTDSLQTISINHITPNLSIGNTLKITLRQKVGSELSFVTFATRTDVKQDVRI